MINTKVYGIYGEGRALCISCAERVYGDSLEMYLDAGEAQTFTDNDRPMFSYKGLLCDACFNWIFQPDQTEDKWWLVEPAPEEHLRLLVPFADFLEILQLDTRNLRSINIM